MTLAFVTAIAALIAVGGSILQRGYSQTENKAFLVQSNTLLPRIYTILKQNTGDINDSDTLDILLSVPLFFENKRNGMMMDITFASDAGKVNINHLLKSNSEVTADPYTPLPLDTAVEGYLERILSVYNVSDTILLISMVADSIDMDTNERFPGSELSLKDPDFTQGHLYNMPHFKQVLDAYKAVTFDFTVDEIPWEHLIGFRNETIDFNHIEPDTLHFIDPAIDPATLAEMTTQRLETYASLDTLPLEPETRQLLEDLGVAFYAPNVVGTMNLMSKTRQTTYSFTYNLANQKVSEIAVSN
ncbi:hypothetical protein ACM66T_11245 [Sulfurimonas sp. ST-25]|uniref:hypothetical protein n=1 Tax=Sulfurimonas sp. ST-25 TaxID=3400151 RepID=UPI003A83CB66